MKHFKLSLIFTLVCVVAAFSWGGAKAAFLALVLGVLEVSLSFDNAVVNASVLKRMSPLWQQRFLTWGIVVAVFGMRLLFPIVIVAFATGMSFMDVTALATNNPAQYSQHLRDAHPLIAAFGGMFLLLVSLSFLLDEARDIYWLGILEQKLQALGKLDAIHTTLSLSALLLTQSFIGEPHKFGVLIGGVWGILLYGLVSSLDRFFQTEEEADGGALIGDTLKQGGVMAFCYIELLDASFSFDGVIGAFAITRDIVIIMLGLGIGAMFVRSLTVFLVNQGTLDEYVFLEHGAHYAIGILAVIMLASTIRDIPEVFTALIGATLIVLSVLSSIRYKRQQAQG
jgi:hypothetical protein